MKINLMGNYVPNDAEIEATMQLEINDAYAPAKREKILRTGVGKDALDAYFVGKGVEKATVIADRDLLVSAIAYEQAEARLMMASPSATVDGVDEAGSSVQVPNPVVVQDEAERAAAQSVIVAVTTNVLDLVKRRKGL